MRNFLDIAKALANKNRVRILMSLRDSELSGSQISAILRFTPSATARHLSVLRQSGLIESRKKERRVFFRLPDIKVSRVIRFAIDWAAISVEKESRIIADAKRRKNLSKADPSETLYKSENKPHGFHPLHRN